MLVVHLLPQHRFDSDDYHQIHFNTSFIYDKYHRSFGGICFSMIMFNILQIKEMIKKNDLSAFYNDTYWRKLSHEIIKENNNECYICKQNKKYSRAVLVHHVNHLKKRPNLAYCKTYTDGTGEHIQLMPLCHDCHEMMHQRGMYKITQKFTNTERW